MKEHAGCQVSERSAAFLTLFKQEKSLLCTVSLHRKPSTLWRRSNSSSTRNSSVKTSSAWSAVMERSSCISVSCEWENSSVYWPTQTYSRCTHFVLPALMNCPAYVRILITRLLIHFLLIVDEEEITFAPTYRFERDTREKYAYTKAKATGVSLCLVRCFPCMAPVRPHNAETLQATTEWNKWPRTCFFALRHLCTKLPVRMLWLVENSRYNPFTGTRINLSF